MIVSVNSSRVKTVTLFHVSIPYQKVHMKEEINGKDTKKEIRCQQSPDLSFTDQPPIEIQTKGANEIDGTSSSR